MRKPVLLTTADFYGTMAAVRCLGRAGIPVTIAESRLLAPARWSRYVKQRLRCPPADQPEAFIEWLLAFGRKQPGHVLYASSDDMAWLFARHQDRLRESFALDVPSPEAMERLLDKEKLYDHCRRVGIAVHETWLPASPAALDALVPSLSFPLLIKPRTQVFLRGHAKGDRIDRAEDLAAHYAAFEAQNAYAPSFPFASEEGHPLLQAYLTEAAEGIYSLAGFIAEGGEHAVFRASNKVLQRPRRLGIGLCFEAAAVDPALSASVVRLCQEVGYHGVFEVEFIKTASGRHLLIDFNPRFYSQMAFEIARAQQAMAHESPIYCHRALLALLVTSQVVSGRMSRSEARAWRSWYRDRGSEARIDAVADRGDRLPALVDLALHGWITARHPRAFMRSVVLDE